MNKFSVLLLVFLLGGVFGWAVFYFSQSDSINNQKMSQIREGGYVYINPLLDCEQGTLINEKTLNPFKKKVETLITQLKKDGSAEHVSVYYRDLNNGPWFGIEEDFNYAPQSLLKVPMMIAYLRLAESQEDSLDDTIAYREEDYSNENLVEQAANYNEGEEYTIRELIDRMIITSDNIAFNMLTLNISNQIIQEIHKDLGIAYPTQTTPDDFISVKSYASLFRVLYNASYLNREKSEQALEVLSRVSYDDGVAAGIPQDITLANKFGIRHLENENISQLHDCGIIYNDSRPYILCVMTRGENTNILKDVIKQISELVYQEVNS